MESDRRGVEMKNIVITGATGGIGRDAARILANQHHRIHIIGRSKERGRSTVEALKRETSNPDIFFYQADLSIMEDIEAAAESLKNKLPVIDVLINNAGALFEKRTVTKERFEETFALNYLGVFLLTHKLLPLMKKSTEARIVNVSSVGHKFARFEPDNLQGEKKYGAMKSYAGAKLYLNMFTYDLAARLESENIQVNAMHPGNISSGFAMNNKGPYRLLHYFTKYAGDSLQQGAQLEADLAVSESYSGMTGKYFTPKGEQASSAASYNKENQKTLRKVSESMLSSYI